MFENIGIPGLIMILIVALLIFGPNKLPEIGRAFGKGIREFRDSMREITEEPERKREQEKGTSGEPGQERQPEKVGDTPQ
ncbi:twin-arginine translocase TatA/TatE family subunit [Effusibacillus pohliae]|uniref:twin-arginine translocase TatA/TatE family subunit n=1 Tax=Effusibacillus pohliae TaxID=232270 RepID=UPI000381E2E0|nr:twin-arginine translocase TatA/TatE family subunit [Effusibacillus pohliae]